MANGRRSKKRIIQTKLNKYKNWKNILVYGLVFLFLAFIFMGLNQPKLTEQTTIPLSQAIKDTKDGKVQEIEVYDNKLVLKEGDKELQAHKEPGSDVYTLFKDAGVNFGNVKVIVVDRTGLENWMNIAISIIPIILMVGFFYFIFSQARGAQDNIFSFGKSQAKLYSKDTPKIGFDDVAGVDEAKQELREIVDFLKNPSKYRSVGARTPKG